MKQLDSLTIEHYGIPSAVLMERAALATVHEIREANYLLSDVIVLAGCGNNGGDGVCVARILKEQGISPKIYVLGKPDDASECAHQLKTAEAYGLEITYGDAASCEAFLQQNSCSLLIDAIFGVGLSRPLSEDYNSLIRTINNCRFPVVCIDIPTGLDATSGKINSEAVQANLTVTYGYYKIGQLLYPGCICCDTLKLHTIGIVQDTEDIPEDLYALEKEDLKQIERPQDSHKGTFGKVLLIAGSRDIGGAAVLAAKAAMRSGAGMVRVFTHERNRELLLESIPEVMVTTYDNDCSELKSAMEWADVIGIGPGISVSDLSAQMLRTVLCDSRLPVVLDADAIALLKRDPALMQEIEKPDRQVIITPHLKEFSDLTDQSVKNIKADIVNVCRDYAAGHKLTCVLKDSRTVIADENKTYLNLSGNAGMATAGSGDVLFGLITSLLGQTKDTEKAASFGCFIHGLAGDAASDQKGQAGMVASDMIDHFHEFMC